MVETLVALCLQKAYNGQDPWQEFQHLQASLWSNEFEELQVMKMESILCHYASCKVSSEQCFVISLELMSDLLSMDMHTLSGLGRNEYSPVAGSFVWSHWENVIISTLEYAWEIVYIHKVSNQIYHFDVIQINMLCFPKVFKSVNLVTAICIMII